MGSKVSIPDAMCHFGQRESVDCPAKVPSHISELQPSGESGVGSRAGDDTELPSK
ncbi:MAG: hypothetical protein HONBIEJF_00579 [Fimbriimonadaceae bacterium]|nr:hypothetical protein [Fimbriimonadaceae bacterium]